MNSSNLPPKYKKKKKKTINNELITTSNKTLVNINLSLFQLILRRKKGVYNFF